MPNSAPPELALHGVEVRAGGRTILAIDALEVAAGTLCGIAGPSGGGKTTLLHLVAGLLRPARGSVRWAGADIAGLSEVERTAWRRVHVGFVFQDFHLVPELTALDNVLLPVWFGAGSARPQRAAALALLARVGIATPARRAAVLSRGEQQRVAIARALLHRPALILADEPTASLDGANAEAVGDLLIGAARETGATLLAVSHDRALLDRMDSVVGIAGGRLA